ncbi:hypothetical protein [Alloacidobacterium sp.]|uniref:hypothetical protein n=1 Tax=Alloacidobacterium sp. TaxID=2951999 RepID=UPI002D28B0FA|nr:hypothetical protein [Alloacidobacterium sp.]HYK35679.1 hypothetical protein [Alloacidobacterium sp.]
MAIPRRTVKQVIIEETRKFLVVAFYLWVIFALLVEYKSVILAEESVSIETRGLALINALALGKIIILAQAFHLGEMAEDVPLIYPTVLKSALFSILLAFFKILEVGIVGLIHHRPFAQSITEIAGGTLKGITCVTLIMFVVLIPFFAYGEVRRVLGEDRLRQLFFHGRPVESQPEQA